MIETRTIWDIDRFDYHVMIRDIEGGGVVLFNLERDYGGDLSRCKVLGISFSSVSDADIGAIEGAIPDYIEGSERDIYRALAEMVCSVSSFSLR